MIDALFLSPTPLSSWRDRHVGHLRRRAYSCTPSATGLRARTWRIADMSLAMVIVAGRVVRMLIEGPMETISKAVLCALVLAATIKVMADLRVWRKRESLRGERIARQ